MKYEQPCRGQTKGNLVAHIRDSRTRQDLGDRARAAAIESTRGPTQLSWLGLADQTSPVLTLVQTIGLFLGCFGPI